MVRRAVLSRVALPFLGLVGRDECDLHGYPEGDQRRDFGEKWKVHIHAALDRESGVTDGDGGGLLCLSDKYHEQYLHMASPCDDSVHVAERQFRCWS